MEAMRNNTAMTPVYTKSCRGGEEELRTLSRVYCVETHLSHYQSDVLENMQKLEIKTLFVIVQKYMKFQEHSSTELQMFK